jgi:hypothetical protein
MCGVHGGTAMVNQPKAKWRVSRRAARDVLNKQLDELELRRVSLLEVEAMSLKQLLDLMASTAEQLKAWRARREEVGLWA